MREPLQFIRQSFTAAEAERITGRSVQSQRHDRHLGLAPPLEGGKARYNVFRLAETLILQTLVNRDIKAEKAVAVARDGAIQVAWWALSEPGKISDEDGTFAAHCGRANWDPASFVMVSGEGGFEYFRYCIIWPTGTWDFCDDIAASLQAAKSRRGEPHGNDICSTEQLTAGAMTLLDLEEIGKLLASRTERPFVEIKYSAQDVS
jgi:hypothetical protein